MPLKPGTKLGAYELLEFIPDSGTGEAYKALDPESSRTVTIRRFPTKDPELTARLEQQTLTLAALPGIRTVSDVVEHDDSQYLVMEDLEGETLAQRLGRGPLDFGKALRTAIAIADSLDQAHRKGVVHRALTPSSVMLTPDGVKILDFGLSPPSARIPEPAAVSLAATASTPLPQARVADETGSVAYLSPEQLEGNDADARSDIFALGIILYQMLAGKPAFEGKTRALLVAAITTVDPDPVSRSQPLAPPALDFLVSRCLAKDPRKRLQTVRDLLAELRWIAGEDGSREGLAASLEARKKRERLVRIGFAAAVVLLLALSPIAYLSFRGRPDAIDAQFIVHDMGFAAATPYLSSNGRWLTSARGPDGLDALALDSVTKQIVLVDHQVYQAFWNPGNDDEMAFWEDGYLKRAPVGGGEATNIVEVSPPFGSGSWSPDGVIVYSSQGLLYRVLDTGGDAVQITSLDQERGETEHLTPVFLPDGRNFLFLALSSEPGQSGIWVGSLDSHDPKFLFEADSRPWYSEPGYILFNREDVVYAQAFDAKSLTIRGEPHRIVDHVPLGTATTGGQQSASFARSATYSVSQTGILAYRMGGGPADGDTGAGDTDIKSLVWFDRDGRSSLVRENGPYAGIDLAPDDVRFAVHRHEGEGGDVWLYDPDQGGMVRWTFDASQENSSPVWSSEGDQIAFASRRDGQWGIYVKAVDGTGPEVRLVESVTRLAPMSWAPNGEIVYWAAGAATGGDIWAVAATEERTARRVFDTEAARHFPQVSPDGNWIAYVMTDDSGAPQIWVDSFPEPQGNRGQITNFAPFALWPRWRGDGETLELYFASTPGIFSVPLRVTGAAIQTNGQPVRLFPFGNPNLAVTSGHTPPPSYVRYSVSGDGQRFLMPQPAGSGGGADSDGSPASGGVAPFANSLRGNVDDRISDESDASSQDIAIVLDWTRLLPEESRQ